MNDMPASDGMAGRVLGSEDATPLEFWVAVDPSRFLQLDDVVALERRLPNGDTVHMYGMVSQVRARHEGARFQSDVFLVEDGVLPAEVSEAALVLATRFDPEVFVPPLPGAEVRKATGEERDRALYFDQMRDKLPAGLSRDGEPVYLNLEFLDGRRGAHVNISGVSGVATKTSYATFLLYSLFASGALGQDTLNSKVLIFNVKSEDLLFLDKANARLDGEQRARYGALGFPAVPFDSVELWAPPRRGDASAVPDVSSRPTGVGSFFWTIAEFCRDDLLQFLFADAEDDRAQYPIVIHNVMAQLRRASPLDDGGALIEGYEVRTFSRLVEVIDARIQTAAQIWAGQSVTQGTINAFLRRLYASVHRVEHLIRGDVPNPDGHRIRRERRVTVVDIHNLNERAQRFVVGALLRTAFEEKERAGGGKPLLFVLLDELNKYAPREGSSPIKEILLDIAERGRSLGIILLGAQQTASEVERRVIANSSIRVVGRLDSAEAARGEYGFLPPVHRQRAVIIKPGTMIVSQPQLPIPLVLEFPFPAWATHHSEVSEPISGGVDGASPADPFDGLVRRS